MTFDPNRRVAVEIKAIERARLRYNLKLWLYTMLILGIPFALVLWLIWEYF